MHPARRCTTPPEKGAHRTIGYLVPGGSPVPSSHTLRREKTKQAKGSGEKTQENSTSGWVLSTQSWRVTRLSGVRLSSGSCVVCHVSVVIYIYMFNHLTTFRYHIHSGNTGSLGLGDGPYTLKPRSAETAYTCNAICHPQKKSSLNVVPCCGGSQGAVLLDGTHTWYFVVEAMCCLRSHRALNPQRGAPTPRPLRTHALSTAGRLPARRLSTPTSC